MRRLIHGRKYGISLLPETQAIVERALAENFVIPNNSTLKKIDLLINEMISIGYWQKRDLILNFAYANDSLENFTRINFKNPTGALATYVKQSFENNNLFQWTEVFDNSIWQKISSTITANFTTAPDSTNTADRYSATGNSRVQQNMGNSLIPDEFYNFSIYAKNDNCTEFRLQSGSNTMGRAVRFDLSNGAVTAEQDGAVGTIEDVGNGWYRCSMSYIPDSSIPAFSIPGGESVFIWGAQITRGATLQSYGANNAIEGRMFYLKEGSLGPGASSGNNYIDTKFNTSIHGSTYTLNDASRDVVLFNNSAITPFIISGIENSTTVDSWRKTNTVAHRINQVGNTSLNSGFDLSGQGYKSINRVNSTTVTLINKDVIDSRTANSSSLSNTVHTLHKSGSLTSDNIISYFSIGASVVNESQAFRNAYNNYLTAIGLIPYA